MSNLRQVAQAALEALRMATAAWGQPEFPAVAVNKATRELEAALAEPQPEFRGPAKWTPEEIADDYRGIRWIMEDGVHGRPTESDLRRWLAQNPSCQEPQPEPVASKTPHFTIMWTICRFALAQPTEVLLHQIGRFADALEGKEQQSIRALLIRAQNQKPQVPCTPLVPSAAPQAQQPQQPMTRVQIDEILNVSRDVDEGPTALIRRVERAHGIGVKP